MTQFSLPFTSDDLRRRVSDQEAQRGLLIRLCGILLDALARSPLPENSDGTPRLHAAGSPLVFVNVFPRKLITVADRLLIRLWEACRERDDLRDMGFSALRILPRRRETLPGALPSSAAARRRRP